MFIGEYTHTIDDKGRIAIPKKFRADLAGGAVVTRGLDNCLTLYSRDEWQKMAEKLSALPISQANARAFARLMLAGAMDVDLDGQGRVILPGYLRKFASIKNATVVAGMFNRIEIWDEEAWREYQTKAEQDSNEIAEKLGELGV